MPMAQSKSKRRGPCIRRYIFTGIVTVIPIWVTWMVFQFVFIQLSNFGMPWVKAFLRAVEIYSPSVSNWLLNPWFQSFIAVVITLVSLYLLGWATSLVLGKRLLALFDWFMHKIPLVQTVYGSIKRLLAVLQQKPEKVQRVVLISFPSPEMKTVGFVTRILTDTDTGQELAAVYVPTTPNPTSGYLEIVPLEDLISTDWSLDEAMTFVISGGAVAPDRINYAKSIKPVSNKSKG